MFDKLTEVRDVARARAREDFEYFANYVMGAQLPTEFCTAWQRNLELGTEMPECILSPGQMRNADNVVKAWFVLLDRDVQDFTPSQTYIWLFGELRSEAA